jgi:cytochrome c peroxidase
MRVFRPEILLVEVWGAVPTERTRARRLNLPERPYSYANVQLPQHFPGRRSENTPRDNPVTDHGATLGRVLFCDSALSADGRVSCASCHLQSHGFADPRRFSRGVNGQSGSRNAPGIVNASYHPSGRFFWDERAPTLEAQVLLPIQDPKEMAADLEEVVARLGGEYDYARLFTYAFGDPRVTVDRISRALAQFVRSLVSYRTKFDVGMAKVGSILEDFPNFTKQENEGKAIFLGRGEGVRVDCSSCHLTSGGFGRGRFRGGSSGRGSEDGKFAIFMGRRPQNNGLDDTIDGVDNGVGDRTGLERDKGLFKSPSLRNIELTAPYMHGGRFKTLEAVIDHYSRSMQAHPNLDRRLAGRRSGGPRQMNLTSKQKQMLIAFLKTLTDHEFVLDPRFSDPFR